MIRNVHKITFTTGIPIWRSSLNVLHSEMLERLMQYSFAFLQSERLNLTALSGASCKSYFVHVPKPTSVLLLCICKINFGSHTIVLYRSLMVIGGYCFCWFQCGNS